MAVPRVPDAGSPTAAGRSRAALDLLRRPRRILPVTVPLLVLALVGLVEHTGGRHIDLEVYRFGVTAWLAGGDLYGPLPETAGHIALPYIYPPFAALLMTPLALVPWPVAWAALLALSTAALGLTFFVVARALWPAGGRGGALSVASIVLPLALACSPTNPPVDLDSPVDRVTTGLEPIQLTVEYGQINLLLMALVVADCLVRRPPWRRGVVIGIAAAIKLTPAAFVLYFLLRGDRRAAVTAAGTAVATTALGFVVAPTESLRFWLGTPTGGVSGAPFFTNQSVQAVLGRAGIDGPALTVIWLVLCAALLALAWPVIRDAPPPLAVTTLAGLALLVSPTSWSHHWVWVAPALLVSGVSAWRARSAGWALVTLVAAVVFVQAPHQLDLIRGGERELGWTAQQQLQGSTYVWFTAALLVALHLWWRRDRARRTAAVPSR